MVDLKLIIKLRNISGAGIMDCKEALQNSTNLDEAIVYLRKKGLLDTNKRSNKPANEGTIGCYMHTGSKVCAIVEINCETDFVSKSKEFQQFAHDVAMHIAAACPQWISREDVPNSIIEQEKDIIEFSIKDRPPNIKENIVNGKLNKFFKETCLLEQLFIKDPKLSIQDLFNNLSLKVKENMKIKRFTRFEVGK